MNSLPIFSYWTKKIFLRHEVISLYALMISEELIIIIIIIINHLLSECPKLAQTEYKRRHDNVAKGVHWDLCKHYGVERGDKWYEHVPEPVVESSDVKILCDFTIQTDKKLLHNKPEIVVVEKTSRTCHIIDYHAPVTAESD